MGDDTDSDWLKKKPISNPIRMSLRRSNRFFPRSPDMDASLISNHGKQNQQSLAVPRIIRRTSINLERLKEMKFKVPAPPSAVQEKANVKKQTMGIPRPYGAARGRQSTVGTGMRNSFRPNMNQAIPKNNDPGIKSKPPQRPSFVFGPRKSTFVPTSANRKPNIVERLVKLSESCAKYDSERSILESSRLINQSTPNDPSAPRSILKQTQSAKKRQLALSRSKLETTEKPKAAKKVNFNEKENVAKETKKPEEKIPQIEDFSALEESTIAFTDSFKPIAFDEPKIPAPETKPEDEIDSKEEGMDLVDEIINSCQAKWEEINVCHQKLKSLREAFAGEIQKLSVFDPDDSYLNSFSLYRAKRDDIFREFKKIDKEFDETVKNKIDIRSELQKYISQDENIQKELSDVHLKFKEYTESLRVKKETEKPTEVFKNPTNPVVRKKAKESPSDNLKKVSDRSRAIRKPAPSKYNSKKKNAIYNDLQQSLHLDPLGSSPDELANTPDNTPAKRRRLSKKIQRQLNTLFEDE